MKTKHELRKLGFNGLTVWKSQNPFGLSLNFFVTVRFEWFWFKQFHGLVRFKFQKF